jgi:hypothetical protein
MSIRLKTTHTTSRRPTYAAADKAPVKILYISLIIIDKLKLFKILI